MSTRSLPFEGSRVRPRLNNNQLDARIQRDNPRQPLPPTFNSDYSGMKISFLVGLSLTLAVVGSYFFI